MCRLCADRTCHRRSAAATRSPASMRRAAPWPQNSIKRWNAWRDLYDHVPCGYHSVGADGTIVAMNRTELQWLGYRAEEVVGHMKFADLLPPAGATYLCAGCCALRGTGDIANLELELLPAHGCACPF